MKYRKFVICIGLVVVVVVAMSLSTDKASEKEHKPKKDESEKNVSTEDHTDWMHFVDTNQYGPVRLGPHDPVARAAKSKMIHCRHLGLPGVPGTGMHYERLSHFIANRLLEGDLSMIDLQIIAEYVETLMNQPNYKRPYHHVGTIKNMLDKGKNGKVDDMVLMNAIADTCCLRGMFKATDYISCSDHDKILDFVSRMIIKQLPVQNPYPSTPELCIPITCFACSMGYIHPQTEYCGKKGEKEDKKKVKK